jgi:hypothetical protein
MSKRRARIIPPAVIEGEEFHVSQDRKVYRLSRHGNRRVKGEKAVKILDHYDRQQAAVKAFDATVPPEAKGPELPLPDVVGKLSKEAPEWA